MARSTFRVLFYANGSKEKNGIVPIMGRVTINGTVAQFSCKRSIATPFLFLFASKCFVNGFVERLLWVYVAGRQCVILPIQQFNAFSPLNKSAGKVTMGNTVIRRSVGRTSGLPTDKGKPL